MSEIATSKKQITFYYNSNSGLAKQTLAYAKAEGLPIQTIDLIKIKLTGTQIVELADKLNIRAADLVNQEHPFYKTNFENHNFSTDDWIKMIQNNPEIMNQPIAIRGDITILVKTPTDIINI